MLYGVTPLFVYGERLMSLEKICANKYTDGIHKVKHKLTGEESYVYVGEEWLRDGDDDLYLVLDYKTNKVINNDDYEHLAYYEYGAYYHCEEHPDIWLFDNDETDYFEICPKCKSIEDEISSFKVAEDVYQYNSNREFNRLKDLLKADKYQSWNSGGEDVKPQKGLLVLITEHDAEWGETYYYYKTIEKSFIDELEWGEK